MKTIEDYTALFGCSMDTITKVFNDVAIVFGETDAEQILSVCWQSVRNVPITFDAIAQEIASLRAVTETFKFVYPSVNVRIPPFATYVEAIAVKAMNFGGIE